MSGVDVGREGRWEVDAFANDGREATQREGDRVNAGTQIDDAVLTRSVSDRRLRLLDQHRAADFDRHAGHHRAGGILHRARNRALGQAPSW